MKRKLQIFMCVLLLIGAHAYGQTRTVTGTVTSKDDGKPIPGVVVRAEGNQNGTQTGSNGMFSLKVSENSVLLFSFLGYATQRVPLSGQAAVNVSLVAIASELNEVVVTGVGTATSKRQVAIDVATLGSKEFPKSATTNVTQALQGQIAGAQIQQKSGAPGSSPLIVLRGYTNLSSSQPLILIDGIQADGNLLTSLDPNTIDRVEVVKGAAGGMLYGSQGGNGVIQVFTKKGGKNGKLIIDVSSRYSNERIIKNNELIANNHHWVTDAAGNILAANGSIVAPNAIGVWPDPTALPYGTDKLIVNNKPYLLPTFDHVDQGNRVANTYSNSVNVRGGSEKVDYAFGASNLAQQDVYSNNFNRTNMTLNLGFNPVTGLTIRNNMQLIYTYENLLSSNRFNLVNSLPYIDFNYINPTTGRHVVKPSTLTDGTNPLAEREVRSRFAKTPRLVENFNVNYKFPKYIELDFKFGLDQRQPDSYDYYQNQTGLPQTVFYGSNINGSIANEAIVNRTLNASANLFVRTDFKEDFHIDIPIKTTTQVTYDTRKYDYRRYTLTGTGLPAYPPYNISTATTKSGSDFYESTLLYGVLVNQTIDYGTIFGISGGFRSDYGSAFGGQGKPFSFPRGTVYFNPSELFSKQELISNWKVRAAYGAAGVVPDPYALQVTFNSGALGTAGSSAYTSSAASNAELKIQKTYELEIGSDVTMIPFKGSWLSSLTFSASYWKRTSKDAIQNSPVAPSTGAASILDNLVDLKSNGLDLSLDLTAYKSSNLDWYIGARWANSRTQITKISQNLAVTNGTFTLAPGGDLGALYMQTPLHSIDQLRPDGTRYIAEANAANYTIVDGNVVNLQNYNVVLSAANDLSVVGNVNPDFTSSLINRFTIQKKLTVGFQFDWIKGNSVYNQTRQWLYRDRLHADFDEPITINGESGAYVAYYNSFYNTNSPVSWFVENGSYVRLRDLSVSYDLTDVVKQKWLRSLVFTVSGRNLATFSKYKGLDPEATSNLNNQGGAINNIGSYTGVDYYSAPNLKSYQFSLNVGF